ncbi:hypothetical protein GS415_07955 [Rhodococcus hoagii]|nr:hypothetical protein [Prescottella equi]
MLTQYKSHSLDRHTLPDLAVVPGSRRVHHPVPAQQRLGPRWYTGSADAIFQSLNLGVRRGPRVHRRLGADHVYGWTPSRWSSITSTPAPGSPSPASGAPRSEAYAFGCIDSDESGRITQFLEKPAHPPGPPTIPTSPSRRWVNTCHHEVLVDAHPGRLRELGLRPRHGRRHHSRTRHAGVASVYDFKNNVVPGATDRDRGYWRDVGTIDAFYDAHMDLVSVHPVFNLYNGAGPFAAAPRTSRRPSSSRAVWHRNRWSVPDPSCPRRRSAIRY